MSELKNGIIVPAGTYQKAFLDYPQNPDGLLSTNDPNELDWRRRMPFAEIIPGEQVTLDKNLTAKNVFVRSAVALAFIEVNSENGDAIAISESEFWRIVRE